MVSVLRVVVSTAVISQMDLLLGFSESSVLVGP